MVSKKEYKRSLLTTQPKRVYLYTLDDYYEMNNIAFVTLRMEIEAAKAITKHGFIWYTW